jgi:Tol biopolymer transport system component
VLRVVVAAALASLLVPAPAWAALTVLEVETGKRSTVTRGTANGWTSVRWTADGSALIGVAVEARGLAVRRYPATGGRGRLVRRLPDAFDAVLNRDGTMVAALYDHGLRGRGGVIVRGVASGRALARLPQSAEGDELYESGLELAWSRDGARVAYVASERRGRTLRIADARTGRVLRRVDAAAIFGITAEALSPVGDRIVYAAGNRGHATVLDVATGATRRLGVTGIAMAWAPAGQRIAVSTGEGVVVSGEDQRFGEPTPIEKAVVDLRWAPDGGSLALVYHRVGTEWGSALTVLVPGSPPRELVPQSNRGFFGLQWSPDGRRLAYGN